MDFITFDKEKVSLTKNENKQADIEMFAYPTINVYVHGVEIVSDRMKDVYKGGKLSVFYFNGIKSYERLKTCEERENEETYASIKLTFRNDHVLFLDHIQNETCLSIMRLFDSYLKKREKSKSVSIYPVCYLINQTIDENYTTLTLFTSDGRSVVNQSITHALSKLIIDGFTKGVCV